MLRRIYGRDDPHIQQRYLMLWGMMHGISMLAVERVFGMPDEHARPIHEQTLRVFVDELRGQRART